VAAQSDLKLRQKKPEAEKRKGALDKFNGTILNATLHCRWRQRRQQAASLTMLRQIVEVEVYVREVI